MRRSEEEWFKRWCSASSFVEDDPLLAEVINKDWRAKIASVFDMFYTSDKSRGSAKKHMGLGLYLAEKILKSHGLKISIQNTEIGVRVKIIK